MNQILNFWQKHMNKLSLLLVAVLAVFPLMTDSSYMLAS